MRHLNLQHMRINPYLSFDGQCQAALKLYERCLGAKVVHMTTYAQAGPTVEAPPGWGSKIYHATLSVADQRIGAADAPPGSYKSPQGFSLNLELDGPEEADRIFAMLADNGIVQMALQETFWALRFGVLTDQFGIPWIVQCGTPT